MKYTKDQYTGKRFYYDPTVTVEVGREKTVGRWSEEERRFIYLHPSRLERELYKRLNA